MLGHQKLSNGIKMPFAGKDGDNYLNQSKPYDAQV
jgi:hypothetical protein